MNDLQKINYWKLATVTLLGWYFMNCALNTGTWHFIDNIDLIIHEAGHFIFIFFGEFLHILGGSLTQILLPLIFCGYFYFRRDLFSSSILLLWVGYNIVNVSVYMADAVVMQLPLLGGDSIIHDWNYLLSQMNLLGYTHFLSSFVWGMGIFVIIAGIVLGLRFVIPQEKKWFLNYRLLFIITEK